MIDDLKQHFSPFSSSSPLTFLSALIFSLPASTPYQCMQCLLRLQQTDLAQYNRTACNADTVGYPQYTSLPVVVRCDTLSSTFYTTAIIEAPRNMLRHLKLLHSCKKITLEKTYNREIIMKVT